MLATGVCRATPSRRVAPLAGLRPTRAGSLGQCYHPGRRAALVVYAEDKTKASKAKDKKRDVEASLQQGTALPAVDTLQRRERELWERQAALFDLLQRRHEHDAEAWAVERAAAAAREAALHQELTELRSQLLYLLTSGGATALPAASAPAAVPTPTPTFRIEAAPVQHLPSAADQVRAAMQQVQATPAPAPAPAVPGAAASGGEPPRYAAELAAAMAAVDELDVLRDALDFSELSTRRSSQKQRTQQAPPPLPVAAAAAPAPSPPAEPEPAPAPEGPPPTLSLGSDDIFWVHQLHAAMGERGYYADDDEVEDFYFGESTQSAVLTMQACEQLEETGVVGPDDWALLLGPGLRPRRPAAADGAAAPAPPDAAPPAAPARPFHELFTLEVETGPGQQRVVAAEQADLADGRRTSEEAVARVTDLPGGGRLSEAALLSEKDLPDGRHVSDAVLVSSLSPAAPGEKPSAVVEAHHHETLSAWPTLQDGDGGKAVHALHIALQSEGCYPSEDDIRWWHYGDSTVLAVKTFQACSGAPETGVCCPGTWRRLLGPESQPSDILRLHSGASDDEDLSDYDRVWLIGEQRWEDRRRVKRPLGE